MRDEADTKLIACSACGRTNRVQTRGATGREPVCGQCGARLPAKSVPLMVTDASYQQLVGQSTIPVLLDLWAPWCGPCRMIAPMIEQLADDLSGRVRVAKLNVDDNPRTASQLDARSIPTLVIFAGGREVKRLVGARSRDEILQALATVR